MKSLEKLQELLRDLFQLDLADLDFGMYRLLHLKRHELEAFLTDQLPRRVKEAFHDMAGQEASDLEGQISEIKEKILENIGDDALLENGDIDPEYRKTKVKAALRLIEAYDTKRNQLKSIQVSEAQQAEVFNHLYAFFSRYYEGGDFIPRRRYGSRETYAVPYNGEEVFFHWANKDQHYVKTGENFKDYAFSVEVLGASHQVRFVLTEASLPPGNTKGETRYFFSLPDQASYDQNTKIFRLPFHYRLPTEQEVIAHGKNSRFQESVLQNNLDKILEVIPDPLLSAELAKAVDSKDGQEISMLFKRMRHFCRRNTTDYFIHKNLGDFLKRELEFYLKDQVLNLLDLEGDLEGKRRTIRVTRRLGEEIITFLAQLEEVQKRLFEKKKIVLRTDYLAPIKEVPLKLWGEVLKNKEQIKAWQDLFVIDLQEKINKKFLEDHPTLVVNTSLFPSDFTDRLLTSLDDLDEATDGLLIKSENYQALHFIEQKYAGQVKCIYIDPPYNTGSDEFIYKDRYQKSSWIAMMEERLKLSRELLKQDGVFFSSIDFNEIASIKLALENMFGSQSFEGLITWRRRHNQPNDKTKMIGLVSEYIISFARDSQALRKSGVGTIDITGKFSNPDNDPRGDWASKPWKVGSGQTGSYYTIITPIEKKYDEEWMGDEETFKVLLSDKRIIFPNNGNGLPRKKYFKSEREEEGQCASNWWHFDQFGHNASASQMMADLFGEKKYFDNPKPVELITGVLQVSGKKVPLILDHFAGSGTTAHAVINLNRMDGDHRRFILVEMANYFDTVILPRIQKIIFSPEWKDGKPKRLPTQEEIDRSPRLIKILRLESYEDALHNLTTEATLKRESKKAEALRDKLGGDGYRLSYLFRLPLETNASMLNVAALEHPFNYRIEVLTEKGPKLETVDLVETFNFLIGLHVQRLENWQNPKDKRVYRVVKGKDRKEQRVLVLWRDMKDLDPKIEREFLEKRIKAEGPFGEMLINGDAAVPGVKSLDGIFKRLMEEGER